VLKTKIVLLSIFIPLVLILTFELSYDSESIEAIEYFNEIEKVEDAYNSLFAIAGIAAPIGTTNIHEWGYKEVIKRRGMDYRGKGKPQNILDNQVTNDGRFFIDLGASKKHYVCWFPKSNWEGKAKNCMDESEIRNVIKMNEVLLERYNTIFKYNKLQYELNDSVGIHHTIGLSKLLVIKYWLNRDNLSDEDIETILKFYNYWDSVIDGGTLGLIGLSVALVNEGLASNLIANIAKTKPKILRKYHTDYGEFNQNRVGNQFHNNIIKNEFRFLNSEICLIGASESSNYKCNKLEKTISFKPNRTLDFIYNRKTKLSMCANARQFETDEGLDYLFWLDVFKKPGNFRGRAAAKLFIGGFEKMCDLYDNLNIKAEENGLRNLYNYFKEKDYSKLDISKLYKENKRLFMINDTERYYEWDEQEYALIYSTLNNKLIVSIPYQN